MYTYADKDYLYFPFDTTYDTIEMNKETITKVFHLAISK